MLIRAEEKGDDYLMPLVGSFCAALRMMGSYRVMF